MIFIFCDADKHEIIDIVENCQLIELVNYFQTFSKAARRAVRTICIDFYAPYMILINKLFPKAKIIVDRFHTVQAMKKLNTRIMEYKRLKKYWKLSRKTTMSWMV